MKILHTSDWHLLDKLGPVDRQPDICARLEEIAGNLREHQVDVMLVSGDLFSVMTRMDEIRRAVSDVSRIFRPFLQGGGTIVGISGNHDSEDLFKLFREAMNLAAPLDLPIDALKPSGRMYLYEIPSYIRLADRSGQEVQFALLPYPTPGRYLTGDQLNYRTNDEKHSLLRTELLARLNHIRDRHILPGVPSVLVSHIHVRGQQIHNLFHLTENQDVVFDLADLPLEWAYIAFGHIHRPQYIQNDYHAQYAGSIERFDFAEKAEDKHVVLLEIGPEGLLGKPAHLPLRASPMYRVEINDISEIDHLVERYPDHEQAIVDYHVTYKPEDTTPQAIRDAVEQIFPRWSRHQVEIAGADLIGTVGGTSAHPENVPLTVKEYLLDVLAGNADRDELMTLAEELLADL